MNIRNWNVWFFVFGLALSFMFSCTSEKDVLADEFEALQQVVRAGELNKIEYFMDSVSVAFIREMSEPNNMTPDKLQAIGSRYDLSIWCAEYYKYNSDRVISESGKPVFFEFLAMSETPLFELKSDFELIEDKTRIREEIFIAIARYSGEYRYVNWLEYTKESGGYKLNLPYLLKMEEKRIWNIAKINAEYIHGKKLPENWREEAIEEYYATAKVKRLIPDSFSKENRQLEK